MSKRPIDKTKKSNIKCEHCKYFIQDKETYMDYCLNTDSPKYGVGKVNYWNRCKRFEWISERRC